MSRFDGLTPEQELLLPGADGSTFDADKTRGLLDRSPDAVLRALRFVLSRTENSAGLLRPLFRDYSFWQVWVNFSAAQACGVKLAYMRAGVSWGAPDSTFPVYYANAGLVGMPRTSYHVLYADQPVIKQADQVWYVQHPKIDKVPRVIDLEAERGVPDEQVADRTWEMSNLVLARDGIRPLIYSRKNLIDKWLASWTTAMLNAHHYILAQYLFDRVTEHPGPPALPNRVLAVQVIGHQTADKKPGCADEAGSPSVDYNRWTQGDEAQMDQFMLDKWGVGQTEPPPDPIVPKTHPDPADVYAKVINPAGATVRKGAAVNQGIVGSLAFGAVVPAFERIDKGNGTVWLHIRIPNTQLTGWVAQFYPPYANPKLLEFVFPPEDAP